MTLATPAFSQNGRSLSDVLRGSPPSAGPLIGRYISDHGPGFVLDRSNPTPLLKFDNSDEVWVLRPKPAGRGDTVYVNDAGEVVLRATRLGGLTIFTDERPQGAPVALRGGAAPLPTNISMSPGQLVRRLREAGVRIADVLPKFEKINFDTDSVAAPMVAEAAWLAAEVIEDAVRHNRKLGGLGKMKTMVVRDGPSPSADLQGQSLVITVTPGMGLAGRPSSERIRKALR